jgi:hypothetical protein
MSIDASHFAEITTQLHMLWSGRSYSYLGHSVLLISVFFIDETCNINYASQNLVNIIYKSINLNCFIAPFQITVILVLLYQQMQLAIIPGVALLLSMIPINLFLQKIQKNLTVCMYV